MRVPSPLIALVSFCLMIVPAAHAERVFRVVGTVRAPLDIGRIVVAHEEIVGFMPAMTMAFDVAGSAMLQASRLNPGDRVRFALHVGETRALADQFQVIGHGAPAAPVDRTSVPAMQRLGVGDIIPPFHLENQDAQSLTRESLVKRGTLITFIFTRCPVPNYCPLMAQRFGQLQRVIEADPKLNGQVGLLSITLDPKFDQPMVLKAYGQAVGAEPAIWQFATGSDNQIGALVTAFSIYREKNGATLEHTLCTALIAPGGRITNMWRGNDWTIDQVRAAMESLSGTNATAK
ncbi:MAG TPA: SCO family protein [Opitutaceae bacterium]|nr:SCO family protein [Opitutaceae bacterium]